MPFVVEGENPGADLDWSEFVGNQGDTVVSFDSDDDEFVFVFFMSVGQIIPGVVQSGLKTVYFNFV